jgi:hypothetical protein
MSAEMKSIDNIVDLRNELKGIPHARLQFAKVMTDLLTGYNISVSGELLGRLNIAHCDELERLGNNGESFDVGTWTN